MAAYGTSGFTQKHLNKYLETFGSKVVTGAEKNIIEGRHIRTGRLLHSLDFKAFVSENSFRFEFYMMHYGIFLDQGTRHIKATYFFTKPFEKSFAELEQDVIEAFGLDIDEFFKHTMDTNPSYKKYYETK